MSVKRPVVAYLRVSTEKQELETQKILIENWARKNNIQIDFWLTEIESGKEDTRPEFQRLRQMVREGMVGSIVVAELSRLSRRMRTLVSFLYEALDRNIDIYSCREAWFNDAVKNELIRPIIISMFSTLYEIERVLISERTRAGLRRARAQGKHIGRKPKLSKKKIKELIKLYEAGVPISKLAKKFNISRTTVYSYINKYGRKI